MGIYANRMTVDFILCLTEKIRRKSKNKLRTLYKRKRKQMSEDEVKFKSQMAQTNFLSTDIYKNACVVMIYLPLGNETDTRDIIKKAFSDGKKVVLPVTDKQTGVITPVYITDKTDYKKGAFSVIEPQNCDAANSDVIDVILVPGIVFDKKGGRIGFGKGCYDMLLKNTKAVRIGYCYDFQLKKSVPKQKHDCLMDYIITEKNIHHIR